MMFFVLKTLLGLIARLKEGIECHVENGKLLQSALYNMTGAHLYISKQ
jgi:hypothetical protein